MIPRKPITRKFPKQPTVWQHPDVRRSMEGILQALGSDDDVQRTHAVRVVKQDLLPGVRHMVLEELITVGLSTKAAGRSPAVRALREVGAPIEYVAFLLARARKVPARIRLIELLADISTPRDVFTPAAILRQVHGEKQDSKVFEAVRTAVHRLWPGFIQLQQVLSSANDLISSRSIEIPA